MLSMFSYTQGCDLSRKVVWEGKGGSLNIFGSARGLGCPSGGISILLCDELLNHALGKAGDCDTDETSLSVRIQLSFSHSSDLLWRLSKLPYSLPATLNSLQPALEVSADLDMGKVFPARRAGRRAGKAPAVEPAVARCI